MNTHMFSWALKLSSSTLGGSRLQARGGKTPTPEKIQPAMSFFPAKDGDDFPMTLPATLGETPKNDINFTWREWLYIVPFMCAKLIIASSENSADLYWATKFTVPDPIFFLQRGKRKTLIASDLEYGRAKKEAAVDEVLSYAHYLRKLQQRGRKNIQDVDVLHQVLREKKIRRVEVPTTFPFRYAEELSKRGVRVTSIPDPFFPNRPIKSHEEKGKIIKTLRATEATLRYAIGILKCSRIRSGRLYYKGTVLTSERLRGMMELHLMGQGYLGQRTIVACGRQSADPHCVGSGPLYAGQPIVIDVFPKSIRSGYYGDMTRTVVRGRPSDPLKKMYAAVRKSQEVGISLIRHDANGSKIHEAVSLSLQKNGFKTGRRNGKPEGFIHSTGHGLGLDIHEPPRISRLPATLKKGNVVTVEPGLYYANIGGIRIEDVVYVTKTGCEVLTRLPKVFEI